VSSYITTTNTTGVITVLSNNQSLSSIAVGSYNNIWGISAEGNIFYFNHTTSTWEKKMVVPSGAKSISLYEDNAIYAIGINNKIYKADLTPITTSIDDNEVKSAKPVYPNPTSAEINFTGKGELLDLSGKKIAEGNNSFNLSELTNGLYFLKTDTGTHKVIKR
jgi:hypothetical protein